MIMLDRTQHTPTSHGPNPQQRQPSPFRAGLIVLITVALAACSDGGADATDPVAVAAPTTPIEQTTTTETAATAVTTTTTTPPTTGPTTTASEATVAAPVTPTTAIAEDPFVRPDYQFSIEENVTGQIDNAKEQTIVEAAYGSWRTANLLGFNPEDEVLFREVQDAHAGPLYDRVLQAGIDMRADRIRAIPNADYPALTVIDADSVKVNGNQAVVSTCELDSATSVQLMNPRRMSTRLGTRRSSKSTPNSL